MAENGEAIQSKNTLVGLVSDAVMRADELRRAGRDLETAARLIAEVSPPMLDLLSAVDPSSFSPVEWDHLIRAWQEWHRLADEVQKSLTSINTFYATSFLVTNTSSTSASVIFSYPVPSTPKLLTAKKRLEEALQRIPLLRLADVEMRRLGLDRRGGSDKPALALLNDAQAGFGVSPAAALIPLRESIEATVSELLRRRPVPGPAPKLHDKIISIGRQCGRPGLAAGHFEVLAFNGGILINQLSGAKQDNLTLDGVSDLFNRGLVFLTTLLASLDEATLRHPVGQGQAS